MSFSQLDTHTISWNGLFTFRISSERQKMYESEGTFCTTVMFNIQQLKQFRFGFEFGPDFEFERNQNSECIRFSILIIDMHECTSLIQSKC